MKSKALESFTCLGCYLLLCRIFHGNATKDDDDD